MKKITFLATLLTATTLATSATAELIDYTTNKTVSAVGDDVQKTQQSDKIHTVVNSNARWIKQPKIRVSPRDNPCYCTPSNELSSACYAKNWTVTSKLLIDKEGNISSVKVVKSDTNNRMERSIKRSLRRGQFHPFIKNGQAVSGTANLSITIVNSEYNSNLQCPVVDSGETQQN